MKRLGTVAAAAVLFAVPCSGAAAQETTTVRACVKKSGEMRMLMTVTAKCRRPAEKTVSWNATGVQGLPGVPGKDGANGRDGASGAQGEQGIQGPKGDPGEAASVVGAPAGGHLAGTYPNPMIANGVVGAAHIAVALLDGAANTPTLRSLGSGPTQAVAGNDARLFNHRVPTGAAGGDITGTYPSALAIGAGKVTSNHIAEETIDTTDIKDGSIWGTDISPGAIHEDLIQSYAVTTDKLGMNRTVTINPFGIAANSCGTHGSSLLLKAGDFLLIADQSAIPNGLLALPLAVPGNTNGYAQMRLCNFTDSVIDPPQFSMTVFVISS